MKLKKLHIENYRCVRDSIEFAIDESVTCLVGKNQSGKTTLLQALEKLKPVEEADAEFREVDHYPRLYLIDYQERCAAGQPPANVVTSTWTLEEDELEIIHETLGPVGGSCKEVTIRRGYGNKNRWDFGLTDEQNIEIVSHYLAKHDLTSEEREPFAGAKNLIILKKGLSALEEPEKRQTALLEDLESLFGDKSALQPIINEFASRVPTMVYFPEYWRLPGRVSIDQLKQNEAQEKLTREDRMVLALLSMVGKSLEDLEKIDQHEQLIASLEAVGNRLTRTIFKYWTQNRDLKVKFDFRQGMAGDDAPFNTGWILRTRIENPRHGVTTSFDEQSTGFQWFFSFLVWFSQVRKNYGENLLLLLDEPGLSLHGKAQEDLLRYFEEELAPNYQLIYTTHSPFMIDATQLQRARTVEDVFIPARPDDKGSEDQDLGTQVNGNILTTDRDTLFPLQASLGYSITQSLFIGEHTLLVEGPSEILYFTWFKRKLASLGRATLDPRWVICPAGGIDKIPAFVSLFAGNKLHIAVVADIAKGQKKKVRDLRESKLLREGHVLTADMYAGQAEADVEDLVGRATYCALVARAYNLPAEHQLPAVRPDGASMRVVKEVEAHFKILPVEVQEFDHYRPAEDLLCGGLDTTFPELELALDRFEKLFTNLNAML